jgi:hypothetical protein
VKPIDMKPAVPTLSLLFSLLSVAATGCGFQLNGETDPSANVCSVSADCGADGACVSTRNSEARCVATTADLGTVIIEVRPTGSQASFVFDSALNVVGDNSNGLLKDLDFDLPASVEVSATVEAPGALPEECIGSDGSLPVDITLIRHAEFSGFASRYEIPSPLALEAAASFAIAVQPGDYDMYVQPHPLPGCEAPLPPPQLVRNVNIAPGQKFDYAGDGLNEATALSGKLTVPVDVMDELDGWVLEVLDPTYGYVISNQFPLSAPVGGKSYIDIEGFSYHRDPDSDALLRLRDLNGNLRVHWALNALDLNSDGVVELDLNNLVADTHAYPASVVDSAGVPVASAAVIIQSTSLTGTATQNASFIVETRTDTAGDILVDLVEGTYAVTIVPDVAGDATYFGEWEVIVPTPGDTNPKGFVLVVQPVLSGSVYDPLGAPLPSVPISIGPSQLGTSDYFSRALDDPQPLKRQFSTNTFADGSFTIPVDPGEIDIAVPISAESGYPWAVLPRLKVDAAELKPQLDVGDIQLRYPAVVQGFIRDGGAAVGYAQVRAWVRGGIEGESLIQIGAVTTDADGSYILPLPPRITIAETAPADTNQDGE